MLIFDLGQRVAIYPSNVVSESMYSEALFHFVLFNVCYVRMTLYFSDGFVFKVVVENGTVFGDLHRNLTMLYVRMNIRTAAHLHFKCHCFSSPFSQQLACSDRL